MGTTQFKSFNFALVRVCTLFHCTLCLSGNKQLWIYLSLSRLILTSLQLIKKEIVIIQYPLRGLKSEITPSLYRAKRISVQYLHLFTINHYQTSKYLLGMLSHCQEQADLI